MPKVKFVITITLILLSGCFAPERPQEFAHTAAIVGDEKVTNFQFLSLKGEQNHFTFSKKITLGLTFSINFK